MKPKGKAMARWVAVGTFAAALAGTGCGNYSNEDLEFMSAIPEAADVELEVPRRGLLVTVTAAEGWRTTLEVTRALNRTAGAFLALIDKIRTFSPTRRRPNERVWGPFPAEDHPGWQVAFHMTRTVGGDGLSTVFSYQLVMIPPAGVALPSGNPSTPIISGDFDASGGLRFGEGHLTVTLDESRAAGLQFNGLDQLRTLAIDYRTRGWPRTVTMMIENLPSPTEALSATYVYEQAETGDGAMTFSILKDEVPSPLGTGPLLETLMIQSRWLGTGPGRVDTSVSGGDVPGIADAAECWGEDYRSVYKFQSWALDTTTGEETACISRL